MPGGVAAWIGEEREIGGPSSNSTSGERGLQLNTADSTPPSKVRTIAATVSQTTSCTHLGVRFMPMDRSRR